MVAPFTGGCACGAVRYECSAEPTWDFMNPELAKFPKMPPM